MKSKSMSLRVSIAFDDCFECEINFDPNQRPNMQTIDSPTIELREVHARTLSTGFTAATGCGGHRAGETGEVGGVGLAAGHGDHA